MTYSIKNDKITATFATLGAEIISVKKGEKEYIWQNPTGEWKGHAPLLFPVCGRCGVKVNGVAYPIPFHGVARQREFTVEMQSENSITFTLKSDCGTKKEYPFDFIFRVTYALQDDTLSVSFAVENPANDTLYFACGSHEAYALDGQVNEYEVEFEKEEDLQNYLVGDDMGHISGETQNLGTKKVFPLPLECLQNSDSIILKHIRSRKLIFRKIGGEEVVELGFDGFQNLLFWRAMDGKFICIEPWTNLPDLTNTEDIEFSTKDGVMAVAPLDTKTLVRTIRFI